MRSRVCSLFSFGADHQILPLNLKFLGKKSTIKEEGGLWVRQIKGISTVSALKLIWRLFYDPGSLWVAWVKQMLLYGKSLRYHRRNIRILDMESASAP